MLLYNIFSLNIYHRFALLLYIKNKNIGVSKRQHHMTCRLQISYLMTNVGPTNHAAENLQSQVITMADILPRVRRTVSLCNFTRLCCPHLFPEHEVIHTKTISLLFFFFKPKTADPTLIITCMATILLSFISRDKLRRTRGNNQRSQCSQRLFQKINPTVLLWSAVAALQYPRSLD